MKRIVTGIAAGLGIGLLLAGSCAFAGETVEIATVQIAGATARPSPRPLSGRLTLPAGVRPAPLVILLHTCGGIDRNGHLEGWADRLGEWGYAALVLDSFTARGVANACAGNKKDLVTPSDQASDAVNAAMVLSRNPAIDAGRIGVIGFSFGGAAAVNVTRKVFQKAQPGLIKAAVAYYGRCYEDTAYGGMPLLMLYGDRDDWGDPPGTCQRFITAQGEPRTIERHVYPGVYHAFDQTFANPGKVQEGHRMQYDYEAAEDSFQRTRVFLDRNLKGAK